MKHISDFENFTTNEKFDIKKDIIKGLLFLGIGTFFNCNSKTEKIIDNNINKEIVGKITSSKQIDGKFYIGVTDKNDNQFDIKVKNDSIKLDNNILGDSIKIKIIDDKTIKVYIKSDKYREIK